MKQITMMARSQTLQSDRSSSSSSSNTSENEDVKEDVKSIDFGLNVGLGYKMENGVNFGARYNLGLANANDIKNSSQKFKNGVFQIFVGFYFL